MRRIGTDRVRAAAGSILSLWMAEIGSSNAGCRSVEYVSNFAAGKLVLVGELKRRVAGKDALSAGSVL
ncbi:hypothetical protein JTE90_028635 [Oedothorax gibbosus]|uniref:Uncharacterized protein n=1 Tax=Oedothorax gibbosus TaxID=931172 RepID=A0AAV6V0N1_9ARAC|nr:hypothetical protein JTE90_028635 [Oedothorax gibbosus]